MTYKTTEIKSEMFPNVQVSYSDESSLGAWIHLSQSTTFNPGNYICIAPKDAVELALFILEHCHSVSVAMDDIHPMP